MRREIVIGIAFVAFLLMPKAGIAAEPQQEQMSIEASMSTTGPQGQSWQLKLLSDGAAELEIRYLKNPLGSLKGRFKAAKERIEAVRAIIAQERFYDLPANISPQPVALHQPDLKLKVTVGEKAYNTRLYAPNDLKSDDRARRFLAIWNTAFAQIPLQPSW